MTKRRREDLIGGALLSGGGVRAFAPSSALRRYLAVEALPAHSLPSNRLHENLARSRR